MKKIYSLPALLTLLAMHLSAQEISVQPWLQNADPHSMTIMWETIGGEESLVAWGLTDTLGQWSEGFSEGIEDNSFIHTVVIEGLEPATRYHYRVLPRNHPRRGH